MSGYPKPRLWKPRHPEKYEGDPTNIWVRSSWEIKFFNWCDSNTSVIKYSSEEVVIPYRCPTDNKIHRYFVDAKIQVRDINGNLVTYLIEIKPDKQTKPPDSSKRKTKRYINEVLTWGKNSAKWKAATEYCKDRGWHFKILTEYDLNITTYNRT